MTIYDDKNLPITGTNDDSSNLQLYFSPTPFIYDFQIALYNKIISYGRDASFGDKNEGISKVLKTKNASIKAVWKAIDPIFKYFNPNLENNALDEEDNKRITFEAFRKGVERLEKNIKINEDMKFGIHCNILFMLHIFTILGINNFNDLLSFDYAKPDINSLIITSNINSVTTQEKLEELTEMIKLSIRKKPRISNFKLLRDWENILYRLSYIINKQNIDNSLSQINNNSDFNTIFHIYSSSYSKEIQLSLHICTLINEYREYFYKDNKLHNYLDKFFNLSHLEYNTNHPLIILSPFYLLYFFLSFQVKFISIFYKEKKDSSVQQYNLFRHIKHDLNKNVIESVKVNNTIKATNSKKIKNLTGHIYKQNIDMRNATKNILLQSNTNSSTIKYLSSNNHIKLIENIIINFISIYSNNVNYEQEDFIEFIRKIKNIQDLYNNFSFGKPLIYYLSEYQINIIDTYKQGLNDIYFNLLRLQ